MLNPLYHSNCPKKCGYKSGIKPEQMKSPTRIRISWPLSEKKKKERKEQKKKRRIRSELSTMIQIRSSTRFTLGKPEYVER
jgi:pyruvate/2-oxoacid:ferredoxin oxidoreductase beta subunit